MNVHTGTRPEPRLQPGETRSAAPDCNQDGGPVGCRQEASSAAASRLPTAHCLGNKGLDCNRASGSSLQRGTASSTFFEFDFTGSEVVLKGSPKRQRKPVVVSP